MARLLLGAHFHTYFAGIAKITCRDYSQSNITLKDVKLSCYTIALPFTYQSKFLEVFFLEMVNFEVVSQEVKHL